MDSPFGLLAELTYRCPLACAYCSNPLNMADYSDELATPEWLRVLAEARELGVLQCHLSGGEPLLRRDLVQIVAGAHDLGLYTNLVTSALGLSRPRAEQLRAAGLDHVQVSIQADEPAVSDRIAGTPSFRRKVEAMAVVKELGWPLTVNVVLHRQNIDRVADVLGLGRGRRRRPGGAGQHPVLRLGLAQPGRAAAEPGPARGGRGRRAGRPRAAAGPDGGHLRGPGLLQPLPEALHGRLGGPAADRDAERRRPALPGRPVAAAAPATVRADALARIWADAPVMTAFRGTDWMRDPCRSCDRASWTSADFIYALHSILTRRPPSSPTGHPPDTVNTSVIPFPYSLLLLAVLLLVTTYYPPHLDLRY
jgi:pyrroloquinoline quinone biosynthesis protein E